MNNLQSVKLGELLISLKTGLNPRNNFKLNTQDAKNWYVTVRELNGLGVDFLPQTDRINDHGLKLINNRSNLEVGDVLFSGTGTIGKTSVIDKHPNNWNIKEGVYSLKPNKDRLESYYLMYFLKYLNKRNIFNKISAGSTVFSVPMKSLEDLMIQIHKLSEQIKISNVLKALDFKIELNNKINAELESIAKTLYDYWFVQFDFPDKNGEPYKTSGGKMLYNDELKKEIPEGWEVKTLGETCEIYQPQTISGKDCVDNGKYFVHGSNGIIGKYDKYNHEESEIIVSCRGDCGNIHRTIPKTWITGNAMVFKMKDKTINNEFLYQSLQYLGIKNISSGSVQGQITRTNVSPLNMISPLKEVVEKFSNIASSIVSKKLLIQEENLKLAELRDWLLPMLMNGQVSIK